MTSRKPTYLTAAELASVRRELASVREQLVLLERCEPVQPVVRRIEAAVAAALDILMQVKYRNVLR